MIAATKMRADRDAIKQPNAVATISTVSMP
jgi:hypothetical protein